MGRAAVIALVVLGRVAAAGEVAPLGACGPLDRRFEAVEMPAAGLRLGGTPIARLGVAAFAHGVAQPIPFQVDERRGRKLALTEGREPLRDDKPDVVDADDL